MLHWSPTRSTKKITISEKCYNLSPQTNSCSKRNDASDLVSDGLESEAEGIRDDTGGKRRRGPPHVFDLSLIIQWGAVVKRSHWISVRIVVATKTIYLVYIFSSLSKRNSTSSAGTCETLTYTGIVGLIDGALLGARSCQTSPEDQFPASFRHALSSPVRAFPSI